MASEIHVIVERLNDAPFNLQLTLAAFDEKSPFELLEVVNLVMGHLSDEHKIDLRDETPERTINRCVRHAGPQSRAGAALRAAHGSRRASGGTCGRERAGRES